MASYNCGGYKDLNCYEWLDENGDKLQTCQYEKEHINVLYCEYDCDAHFGSACMVSFVISTIMCISLILIAIASAVAMWLMRKKNKTRSSTHEMQKKKPYVVYEATTQTYRSGILNLKFDIFELT